MLEILSSKAFLNEIVLVFQQSSREYGVQTITKNTLFIFVLIFSNFCLTRSFHYTRGGRPNTRSCNSEARQEAICFGSRDYRSDQDEEKYGCGFYKTVQDSADNEPKFECYK